MLIDLPSSAACSLVEPTCRVTFYGERSHRLLTVEGFRRNHDYGIKTGTPGSVTNTLRIIVLMFLHCQLLTVWYERESVTVAVKTEAGQLLGSGIFEVLARTHIERPLPSVFTCVQQSGDWCSTMFIREVIGSFVPITHMKQTSSSVLSSSTCLFSVFMWCGASQAAATGILEFSPIRFAVCESWDFWH